MPLRSDLERKLLHSSAWNALSYGGSQILTFLLMIVLARLVTPHAFGLVTLGSLPLLALNYLQESGLGAAVIRRRTDVERAAATQLVFSVLTSALLYIASFAAAPLLATGPRRCRPRSARRRSGCRATAGSTGRRSVAGW